MCSERKHTPGPWQVSGVRQKIGGYPMLMVGPDSAPIASVFYSDRTTADHVASQADAVLISSAPDLLEALEETNSMLEALQVQLFSWGREPAVNAYRRIEENIALIARAQGKG